MHIQSSAFEKSSSKISECPQTALPEFAFIGRSNVGKSSLINMLLSRKDLAKTSGSPGKTRLINHFLINEAWYLVDLPGYGYAKVSKTDRKTFMKMIYNYFEKRENMFNAFVLVDSRHAPQPSDIEFMNWLGEHGIPFSIIMTKLDKLSSSELKKNKDAYHKRMLEDWERLPPFFYTSASARTGREEVLNYIDYCIKLSLGTEKTS
ncbi:MAG: ribosome biogenesis GTP-binding protein YihA/YsxC [Cryomorphaceae bacterium]